MHFLTTQHNSITETRMGRSFSKIVSIGSPPLGPPMNRAAVQKELGSLLEMLSTSLADSLINLWTAKNGFYAFESALHVLPVVSNTGGTSLLRWNSPQYWRSGYGPMADGWFFFAEDIFGSQFCASGSSVGTFDPETGQVERISSNLSGLFQEILSDFEVLTGYPIAHEWQQHHGQIKSGCRLEAIRPFVLGGEFSLQNLREVDAASMLRERAKLAAAIRDLPNGAQLRWPLL